MPTKRSGKVEKTTKRVARKTPVKKVSKPKFTLEVQVNDLVYKGSADSLNQAMSDFISNPNYPFTIKTRALVRFSDGKVDRQVVYPVVRARRLFKIFSIKPDRADLLADQFLNQLLNG